MARTNKSTQTQEKQEGMHVCYVCGKVIAGEYAYIRTRRHTELFIHPGCMRKGRDNG